MDFTIFNFQPGIAAAATARGIDVSRVSHVVNFDIPATAEAYIHRIGRTGRAERKGTAFNLITGEDRVIVRSIDRILGLAAERRTFSDFDYGALPQTKKGKSSRTARPMKLVNRASR